MLFVDFFQDSQGYPDLHNLTLYLLNTFYISLHVKENYFCIY